jgi:predicted ATPase
VGLGQDYHLKVMDAPAFVGRRGELAYLMEQLKHVLKGPAGIVLVIGEAGVGKSRLLAELASRARRRMTVLVGRGSPMSETIPFGVAAEAIEAHLRTLDPTRLADLIVDRGPELAAALPTVAAGRVWGPAHGRLAVLEALARLIARLAEGGPLLLLLDDVHQADPSTWELVGYLGRNPPAAPVLLVAAARSRASDPHDFRRYVSTLTKDGLADELTLGPLNAEAIGDLAKRALGAELAGPELCAWLFDRTRGNVLYAVSLLEELRRDPTQRVVPVSVKERVRIEAAALPADTAEALEIAAVLGHSFPFPRIARALPHGSGEALDILVHRGLLVERGDGGSLAYDFAHPLVQEAIYDTIGASRRRELHSRVAVALAAEPLAVGLPRRPGRTARGP